MAEPNGTNRTKDAHQTNLHLKTGTHFGKYRLKKCLDKGGSCEVWQDRDSAEGILVALKIALVGADSERDNEALLREVRSVSKLRHPNILSVKNADFTDDLAVLATELSTGTLEDCSRPTSFKRLLSIVIQVLEALPKAQQKTLAIKSKAKENDWCKVRRQAFINRYNKVFAVSFRCVECDEPLAESMQSWCGSELNRFDTRSQFSHICPRCHRGVFPEWQFCPGAMEQDLLHRALSIQPAYVIMLGVSTAAASLSDLCDTVLGVTAKSGVLGTSGRFQNYVTNVAGQ